MGEHMVSHGKIISHVFPCKKPTWEYLYLAEFNFRPHPNSENSRLKIRATTTAQLQQQQHHPKHLLDTESERLCIDNQYICLKNQNQNRCGSAVLSVKVKEGAVLLSMAALQDNTMRAARATSLSTWRPCDGTRRTATSHLVIHAKADPAGVPGSCHYQRKVGIQPWTLFDAFERCCCTAAHGYS